MAGNGRQFRRTLLPLTIALAGMATVLPAGCGESQADRPVAPDSRFLAALESIGGAEGSPGTGYGWIDVAALREQAPSARALERELVWAGRALGPGADDLLGDPRAGAALRIDPADADQVVSVSGSFTMGARIDGVATRRGRSVLTQAAAAESPGGEGWTELNLAQPGSQPEGTRFDAVGSLAGRVAVSDRALILTRFDPTRRELEGDGTPVARAPVMIAAAECLGDVDVAQTVPNNFAGAPNVGPEVYAMGVVPGAPASEVLCVLDADAGDIDLAEAELRAALLPGARDAVTDNLIASEVASADVDRFTSHGFDVLRARITPGPEAKSGFLFGAFVRGSLPTFVGAPPPPVADPSVFED